MDRTFNIKKILRQIEVNIILRQSEERIGEWFGLVPFSSISPFNFSPQGFHNLYNDYISIGSTFLGMENWAQLLPKTSGSYLKYIEALYVLHSESSLTRLFY